MMRERKRKQGEMENESKAHRELWGWPQATPEVVSATSGVGLAKRVPDTTRLRPVKTRDPFKLDPDTTRLCKRVGAPDTTRTR
jgi:hypothetical protein